MQSRDIERYARRFPRGMPTVRALAAAQQLGQPKEVALAARIGHHVAHDTSHS
jgi:hypothetical protein